MGMTSGPSFRLHSIRDRGPIIIWTVTTDEKEREEDSTAGSCSVVMYGTENCLQRKCSFHRRSLYRFSTPRPPS